MKYVKFLLLLLSFCCFANTAKAQIKMGDDVKIEKTDSLVAKHMVMGHMWDTPSLWYSIPDSLYYLHFGTPSNNRIQASVNFYLGASLNVVKESLTALRDKVDSMKKGDSFPVEDFKGNKFIITYWFKKSFYFRANLNLENVFGRTSTENVDFCGHGSSLKALLNKIQ